jgi:YggT family protein
MLSVGSLLANILQIFLLALLGRLIFDYVQMFSRTWRPKGILLYFVEAIYTITDPPMKFVGRFVPPLRFRRGKFRYEFHCALLRNTIVDEFGTRSLITV